MQPSSQQNTAVVIGGGLAGLACTFKLCELGYFVELVSLTKVRRSHSVCAQGGINIPINLKGEGDSPYIHAYDTIKGGDFLANQPPVLEMCLSAPSILRLFDRMGCPFNRTEEGGIDFRRFGGTLYHRTAFCGASTGQQLLYALDEQVRRFEAQGQVRKWENHEFLRLILEEKQQVSGVVLQDLFQLKIFSLKAKAAVIATGGLGFLFKMSTNSTFCTGAANGRIYQQGVKYANGEFIQIHPTAIPGQDKMRLISESVRGEGGRVWVYGDPSKQITFPDGSTRPCGKQGEPWCFLEEMYPAYGNLVPRDVGAREVLRVCELGLGIDGKPQVYLDVTHLPKETQEKLDSVLDIYFKFTGSDPRKEPMKIFPAVHYSMGGVWVDWPASDDTDRNQRYRQMTNLPGCFSIGEADYQYHGANRLGANALLACIFSGLVAATEIQRYLSNDSKKEPSEKLYKQAEEVELERQKKLLQSQGKENVHALHEELSHHLVNHVTVKRNNVDLRNTLEKILQIEERYHHISLSDTGYRLNQTYIFANQFQAMLQVAKIITKGALLRNESRGAHAKVEYPHREDEHWLKTTIATYSTKQKDPVISYEPVDIRHIKPLPRDYVKAKKEEPQLQNIPATINLPI